MKIENGDLLPGQALPSVRDLASFLNVNRNTVAQAYQELVGECILRTELGAGTFVHPSPSLSDKKELREIIGESVNKAFALGFGTEDIAESFFNCLATLPDGSPLGKVIVVECNEPTIEHLCRTLTDEMNVKVEGILLQDLEENPTGYKERFLNSSLIICGFNHLEELSGILPGFESKTVGVILQSDMKILNTMMQIPEGETVGYVCVSQRSADAFFNSTQFSGHRKLKRIIAGLNNIVLLNQMLADCNLIFATNFALDQLAIKARPGQEILRVNITIDPSSINYIKERLMRNARS